ncbi:hypothetical protein MMG00_09370 [Ignatzschineria rhizosphaerae]|uniref:HemY N-terminal domain-containing protein n=1 Tax=Ignatzschineria rhizosphaerae TaxID=2923279 RepID=A0ABY3X605_9GAMM|nr:heme biosynthesis HemY N-terminal domain-containing protein [Ignatzschineria rhizosphaerae]UNM95433.1 hypothetical protein MMG00_09370 [Ignatzschineria rhizosphaerae]
MGKLFKTVGWILLIPLLAILLFLIVKDDAGHVLITGTFPIIGPKTINTTIIGGLLFGAIGIIAAYIVIRIIITIFSTPSIMRKFSLNRRAKTAEKQYNQAELALLENKPAVAEDLFLTAAKGSKSPNLCYLGAARAAQLLHKSDRRDRYLREIDLSESKHDREYAEVKRAELLIEAGENDKAESLLKDLLTRYKNYPATLLLAVSLQRQGKHEALFRLLPDLQKALPRLTPSREITQYTQDIYCALFDYASRISKESDQLRLVWSKIPKYLRQDPTILIHYANRLLDVSDTKRAEELLRKEILKTQDERLIMAYAHLYRGDQPQLLKYAKRFNESQPDSAITQYTLAHMLFRSQQYEEAKIHLEKTLQLDPHFVKAYRLLGEIKLIENDEKGALIAFKEAMSLMLDERPKDVIPVDGDLLIASTEKIGTAVDDALDAEIIDSHNDDTKENEVENSSDTDTPNNPDPRRTL